MNKTGRIETDDNVQFLTDAEVQAQLRPAGGLQRKFTHRQRDPRVIGARR
jgi:hypothetical protein